MIQLIPLFIGGALLGLFAGYILFARPGERLEAYQIDPNRPCPACGHADGTIRFDERIRQIIHVCNVCKAESGEETVVKVSDWRKPAPQMENTPTWP